MKLTDLSDDELVASLSAICLEAHRLTARMIIHLIEVEERRLDLKAAVLLVVTRGVEGVPRVREGEDREERRRGGDGARHHAPASGNAERSSQDEGGPHLR